MRIYIAGPMTGYPHFNIPAFDRAADKWSKKGDTVLNPADVARMHPGKDWGFYMRIALDRLLTAQAIAVLPGWEQSRGASLEIQIARTLGLPIYDAEKGELL